MCGITGLLHVEPGLAPADDRLAAVAGAMADAMVHRGPDDRGVWTDGKAGVALGFRRLAILDLSEQGHQPMVSACGRYVACLNGEIYNFRELRAEVESSGRFPFPFRGTSDTEVVLAAISAWGVAATLPRCNGMFALAVWDRELRCLQLARDRVGKKPLYYGWQKGTFLFGSELKALRQHPAFDGAIDRDIVALYLRLGYVPSPYSIYRGVKKLPPGTLLTVATEGTASEPVAYWSAGAVWDGCRAERFSGTDEEAVDELEQLLSDAVGRRMISDVPLGAFLSGGIDSTLIVSMMQARADRPVKTFTIGFAEKEFDESDRARAIAAHLGTDHTEWRVTPEDAMSTIPTLSHFWDEPFADSSQIPTLLLSRLTRRHVTVSLSGDGGDELFAGYDRYRVGAKLWKGLRRTPGSWRSLAAGALSRVPPRAWDRLFVGLTSHPSDKVQKLMQALPASSPAALYLALMSLWKAPLALVPGATEPRTVLTEWPVRPGDELIEAMMFLDFQTYLPDDIMAKVDRATMAASLEGRAPLLDYRVVELAWRLPLRLKVRDGKGKWLLRQLLERRVPRALVEGPKRGFGLPIGAWLRGPLRDWAEALLDEGRLRREGVLDATIVRTTWQEHLSGRGSHQHRIWAVLMFQAWAEKAAR